MSDTPREKFTGRHDQFLDHMERIDFLERELAEARIKTAALESELRIQTELKAEARGELDALRGQIGKLADEMGRSAGINSLPFEQRLRSLLEGESDA